MHLHVRPMFPIVSHPRRGSHVLTLFLDTNLQSSPSHMTYPGAHGTSSSLQQSSPSAMSRLRAASSAFPPGLDLRAQYRGLPTQNNSSHGGTTPRSSSFSHSFTGGYASAPLTAPVDFALPRTPIDGSHSGRDFNIPQLSAPMAPPQDFSNAYNSSLSPVRASQNDRDFNSQVQNNQNNGDQGNSSQGQVQGSMQVGDNNVGGNRNNNNEDNSYLRPVEYETGQKRKRSFNLTGGFESP